MHISTIAVVIGLGLVAACGPSKEEQEHYWTAYRALDPVRAKLAAIDAALPAPGSEEVQPCAAAVSLGPVAIIGHAQLQYLIEKPTESKRWERLVLSDEGFGRMWSKGDAEKTIEESKAPTSEAKSLEESARLLGPAKSLVVLRASRVEPGELGERTATGRAIARNARWDGWAFVYTFDEHPVFQGAFSLWSTNHPTVSRLLEQGQGMTAEDLMYDAMKAIHDNLHFVLSRPGCPND
jgi:hypothetical protein